MDPNDAGLFSRLVDFSLSKSTTSSDSTVVKDVLSSVLPGLLDGKSTQDFVSSKAEAVRADKVTPLPLRIAVANAMVRTEVASAADAAKIILDGGIDSRAVSVETCREALVALRTFGASDGATKWLEITKARFPLANLD